MAAPQVRVGIGVFSLNAANQFLLGVRKGSIGAGTYALPGGHLEPGESFETCAARELLEETGLQIDTLRFLTAANSVICDETTNGEMKHYVTVFMVGTLRQGGPTEPKLLEPDKCERWEWVSWEEVVAMGEEQLKAREVGEEEKVAERLFAPIISLLQQRPGVRPEDARHLLTDG